MRAVFLDFGTVSNGDLDPGPLERAVPGLVIHQQTAQADVALRVAGCEAIFANKSVIDRATIAANPQLKLIAITATGVDNVDLAVAREAGVAVCNLRDYCTASVAQHVFALLLALTHRFPTTARSSRRAGGRRPDSSRCFPSRSGNCRDVYSGSWDTERSARRWLRSRAPSACGSRSQIGRAGRRRPGAATWTPCCRELDVLSLHCPLNEATRGLVSRERLARMKPDAVLINTARGALVDVNALADALKAGTLGGAGIDVLEREPPPPGHPLIDPSIPNLIVTPHVAWAAREARQRCLDELALNVLSFLSGGRRNRVD